MAKSTLTHVNVWNPVERAFTRHAIPTDDDEGRALFQSLVGGLLEGCHIDGIKCYVCEDAMVNGHTYAVTLFAGIQPILGNVIFLCDDAARLAGVVANIGAVEAR